MKALQGQPHVRILKDLFWVCSTLDHEQMNYGRNISTFGPMKPSFKVFLIASFEMIEVSKLKAKIK